MIEVERAGAAESAESYFVGVARVEKSDGPALVEPFLQFSRWNSWGGAATGVDSSDTAISKPIVMAAMWMLLLLFYFPELG
jgi:hypothetical protein